MGVFCCFSLRVWLFRWDVPFSLTFRIITLRMLSKPLSGKWHCPLFQWFFSVLISFIFLRSRFIMSYIRVYNIVYFQSNPYIFTNKSTPLLSSSLIYIQSNKQRYVPNHLPPLRQLRPHRLLHHRRLRRLHLLPPSSIHNPKPISHLLQPKS